MMRRRWSKGQNADFMALSVTHSKSSQVQPNVSCMASSSEVIDTPLISRLSVLTVTRNRSRFSRSIGCSARLARGAGVDVRRRAHLERHPAVADEAGQAAEDDLAVGPALDVVDDADAVAEPLGAAELHRLPDRRQPEGLAGVDGDVVVGLGDVAEGVEVAGRRRARLAAGDVEADDAGVAVAQRQLGDLDGVGRGAHGAEQHARW